MALNTADRLRPVAEALHGGGSLLARVRALNSGGRLPLGERDRLILELVELYRERLDQRYATLLLSVMAPPLLERLKRFRPQPPAIDEEDVAQQLLAEVLATALVLPLDAGALYLERRLILRSAAAVSRWLRREARGYGWLASLDALKDDQPAQ
jgi:hypothetical protein